MSPAQKPASSVAAFRNGAAELLDTAIAELASETYQRMTANMSDDERAQAIMCALDQLDKLKDGIPPDYNNEWVVLLYLTWYQPRQVNLVASICLHSHLSVPTGRLLVVDVGCGAFATLIGMAIAKAAKDTDTDKPITVHGIDHSAIMPDMGHKLLAGLICLLRENKHQHARFRKLRSILEGSRPCSWNPLEDYLTDPNRDVAATYDDIWLTAVHAVYDKGPDEHSATIMKDLLDDFFNDDDIGRQVSVRAFTGMKEDIVKRVAGGPQKVLQQRAMDVFFAHRCDKVSMWRKSIARDLQALLSDKAWRYLSNDVLWHPSQSEICIRNGEHYWYAIQTDTADPDSMTMIPAQKGWQWMAETGRPYQGRDDEEDRPF